MSNHFSKIRSINFIRQVQVSYIFKFLAIFSSFLSLPILIKYLGVVQYGVWSTLLSIVSWIILFDIGVGNGLRNKISESLAKEKLQDVKEYISTAYAAIGLISLTLMLSALFMSELVPWQKVFNTKALSNSEIKSVVNITVVFLFINFWIGLINQVFNGFQKTSLVVFNQFLSNSISLCTVYILYSFYDSSIVRLSWFYGLSLLSSNMILSFWFYIKNKIYMPTISSFNISKLKSIMTLGLQFFIIQIAAVVIFTTDKILITQLFGPEYVTSYDVLFKLFSIITVMFSLINAPLWSAYSDAYHNNDIQWIKKTIKLQLNLYSIIILAIIILALSAEYIAYLWVGKGVVIDQNLVIAMALYILITTWCSIFSTCINAIGKLNVQITTAIIGMIMNIPVSIYFVKFLGMDQYGIVLATVLSLSLFGIFGSLQVYRLISGRFHV